MKIAIMLTGFMRENIPFEMKLSPVLDNYENVDIFVGTWNIKDSRWHKEALVEPITKKHIKKKIYRSYLAGEMIEDYESWQEEYCFERFDRPGDVFSYKRPKDHYEQGWVNRQFGKWYILKRMREHFSDVWHDYDIILRIRTDCYLLKKLEFKFSPYSLNVDSFSWYPEPHEKWPPTTRMDLRPYAFSDNLAWGNPEVMDKYFLCHDFMNTMYEDYNVDISYPEHFLAFYWANFEPKFSLKVWHGQHGSNAKLGKIYKL
jgi:hypothetical protein